MKIFFDASLTGRKEYGENYDHITEALRRAGHEILDSPIFATDSKTRLGETSKEAGSYYDKLLKLIKKADVVFLEVSFPSTSIGHETALALQFSKPVIAMHYKGAYKNRILESINDDKLQILEYKHEDLDDLIEEAISYATQQADTRFNFFISPEIASYLDWVAKERKLPRAVFLRQLIEKDMSKQGYEK
jgi:hypothetical protein